MQRSSPLPVGEYWIDVIDEPEQADFAAWLFEHQSKLKIVAVEEFEAVSWPDCPITEGDCSPPRTWVKFQVLSPVPWDAVKLGFPNIISEGENINSSADTASVPDFSDYCDIGCQAERVAIAAGVVLGGVSLAILLSKIG